MRRLALAAAVVALAACAAPRVNHVAVKPAPSMGAKCDSTGPVFVVDGVVQSGNCLVSTHTPAAVLSSSCPVYVVDGVETASTCAAPKKAETPKCDLAAPIFIVDGVLQSAPCVKPD
jgi:hypothetical protein